jgi:glucokinase
MTTTPVTRIRSTSADRSRDGLLVGVDVGGSKIAVLVVDADFTVCSRHTIPTSVGEPDEAAGQIASAVGAALESAAATIDQVAAVGVGVPGRVDTDTGVVSLAVNLGWHRLPLRERLEAILGVPVAIENDVRAAAAGILERGTLGDVEDFIYLSVGTGISAGVVLDGMLHRGTRGLAGEVGHIVVDADGPRCSCGLRGCLETIASGPAIARAADAGAATGTTTTAADVYAAVAAGNPTARAVVDRAGASLARAIHALVMTYDIERIVLGGGVSRAGAAFLDPIVRELDAMRAASELATDMLPADVVAVSPDGGDVGTWGGISIARALISATAGGVEGKQRPEEVVAREANA